MKPLLTLLILALLSPLFGLTKPLHKTIIIGSFLLQKDAIEHKDAFEKWAQKSDRIMQLQREHFFYFVTRASGPYYVVALEPIDREVVVDELFELIKPVYNDAFVSRVRSDALLSAYSKGKVPEPVLVEEKSISKVVEENSSVSLAKEEARVLQEKQEHSTNTLYLYSGLVLLFLAVIYLLFRQLRSARHVKEIEEKLQTLNSSNDQLSSDNRVFQDSITVQEELIEEMSGKMKHPASEILGKTDKIFDTDLSDKQTIELRNIQESGQVLFAIVDDLLDFMKIRSNKLSIEPKAFNINELLDIVVHSVLDRIEKKDVEVVFDIDKSVPPRIIGDPIRIGQVLTNLLENGIKFTNAGEVRLQVKLLSKNDEKIQLIFKVVDTGVGIEESKLDDIFTPFYQIKNTNSAGLGLSISKALVEMMGGEILVSTEVAKGSTFTFVLDLKQVDADDKRHYRMPDHVYKKRRILIVDYHDNSAKAMQKLLEYFHNEVDIYSQADLETLAPDLSVYEMLFISEKLLTFNLIKQIDPLKKSQDIKVVVVSSMLQENNNSNVVKMLADRTLAKPVNQQNIFDLFVDFYGDDLVIPIQHEVEEKAESTSMPRIVIERTQKEDVTKDDFIVFEGARILLAEDNAINQKVVISLLKESGIRLDTAEQGEIAVKMAQNMTYDLILMDVNMPVMNGYEATKILKSDKATEHIPIVALTGNTLPEEIAKMKHSGMDDRLEKPIKVPALYSVFSKYLSAHPLGDEAATELESDEFCSLDDGIERCGGDKALYKEILKEFVRLYEDSDMQMAKLYNDKRAESLKAMSLDIKGVSASIGAYALAVAAKKINQSSLSSTSMPKFIEYYRKTLEQTMAILRSYR